MSNVEDPHDDDEGQVRRDRSGWLSSPSLPEDDVKLAELRIRYPRWTVWKGRNTGLWWACPPPGVMSLIDAQDLDRLEGKILDIESWETGQ